MEAVMRRRGWYLTTPLKVQGFPNNSNPLFLFWVLTSIYKPCILPFFRKSALNASTWLYTFFWSKDKFLPPTFPERLLLVIQGGVDFPNPGPMKIRSLWVDTGITQCSGTCKVQPPVLLDDFLYTCGRHIAIYLVYRGWTGSNGPCY